MTAPLSPREAQIVARFDETEAAPESLRERVAQAIAQAAYFAEPDIWEQLSELHRDNYRRLADAALAVMRGES